MLQLPVTDPSCAPCAEDANCAVPGNRCVTLDGGGFCARDCGLDTLYGTDDGECPAGYGCVDLGDGSSVCQPETGSCTCLTLAQVGLTRPCFRRFPVWVHRNRRSITG